MSNPLVSGSLSLIVGNFLGALTDKVVTTIDDRVKMLETLRIKDPKMGSLLDSALGVFLHVGMISLGTKLVHGGMPWISQEPAAFTLFLMGIWATSPHLIGHLKVLNDVLLNDRPVEAASSAPLKVGEVPKESS